MNQKYDKLVYPLNLPIGYVHNELLDYLKSFILDNNTTNELEGYLSEDFNRFIYTLDLIQNEEGKLLEIGSNPYFNSILLKKFRKYKTYHTNFFGDEYTGPYIQTMKSSKFNEVYDFTFKNHNIETKDIPFSDKFDIIVLCEVFEHFTNNPMDVLLRIKKSLMQYGTLILTTPNVNRLENVAKMLAGSNIYDPYSGYGPHGRHNREYNKHELHLLLSHLGFEIEIMFSSDVHENRSNNFFNTDILYDNLKFREHDLGQYIFIKAKNVRIAKQCKPTWLYRSYPLSEMCVEK